MSPPHTPSRAAPPPANEAADADASDEAFGDPHEPSTPVDTRLPDEVFAGFEAPKAATTAAPLRPKPDGKPADVLHVSEAPRIQFPWGVVAALVVYALLVTGYLALTHWTSPEYKAAQHESLANAYLGRTDGREVEERFLYLAYGELAEAALDLPTERALHERMEGLHRLIEARGFRLPHELQVRGNAVGALYAAHAEREGGYVNDLVRSVRLKPEQVLAQPKKVAGWAALGGLFLLVFGTFKSLAGQRAAARDREAWNASREEHVEALGSFRTGLKGAPQGNPGASIAASQRKVKRTPPV